MQNHQEEARPSTALAISGAGLPAVDAERRDLFLIPFRGFSLALATAVCIPEQFAALAPQLETHLLNNPLFLGMFSILQREVTGLASKGEVRLREDSLKSLSEKLAKETESPHALLLAELLSNARHMVWANFPSAMVARFLSADAKSWQSPLSEEFRTSKPTDSYAGAYSADLSALEREITLRVWDRILVHSDNSYEPKLMTGYFESRGRPDLAKAALASLAESAVRFEHIADRVFESPEFLKYHQENLAEYKLRRSIHELHFTKRFDHKETARALLAEGHDLKKIEFQRLWVETTCAYQDKAEKQKAIANDGWIDELLQDIAAEKSPSSSLAGQQRAGKRKIIKSKWLEAIHKSLTEDEPGEADKKLPVKRNSGKRAFWAPLLKAFTEDRHALEVNVASSTQKEIWETLRGGDYLIFLKDNAHWGGGDESAAKALGRFLINDTLRSEMHPVFVRHVFALTVGAAVATGELSVAKELMETEALNPFHDHGKLKAAVTIATEMRYAVPPYRHVEEHGKAPWNPSLNSIAAVFETFPDLLKDHPRRAPFAIYLDPAPADPNIAKSDPVVTKIMDDAWEWKQIVRICQKFGFQDQIAPRLEAYFASEMDRAVEHPMFPALFIATDPLSDAEFMSHVRRDVIAAKITATVAEFERKINSAVTEDEKWEVSDVPEMLLSIRQNSILSPFLPPDVESERRHAASVVEESIRNRHTEILDKPLSLNDGYEIIFMEDPLGQYLAVDRHREHIKPEKLKRFIAWVITNGCDLRVSGGFRPELLQGLTRWSDPSYTLPSFFSGLEKFDEKRDHRVETVNRIYLRELELGGIDHELLRNGVTNIVFRSTYTQQARFHPHVDVMLELLSSPLGALLPHEGPAGDALKDYRILLEQLRARPLLA